MDYLIFGLILFLVPHSVRIVADGWRMRMIARIGLLPWKGVYALLSIAGFVLMVQGYGETRLSPVLLYDPPYFTRHVAAPLMLVALILAVAAYVPGNQIKAAVGHPLLAGVKLWAFAHLLTNGRLADVILFGTFLAWSVTSFIVMRRRDRAAGLVHSAGSSVLSALVVVAGLVLWMVFVFGAHFWLTGVGPFG